MTHGVGGSSPEQVLSGLRSVRDQSVPISLDEYHQRLNKLRGLLESAGLDAMYLDATTSLRYFHRDGLLRQRTLAWRVDLDRG